MLKISAMAFYVQIVCLSEQFELSYHFQQIEAIEVKKCDFKDDLFIEGITAYDNERHHFKIARKS
ncbi:hypothetical protein EY02_14715, partial [Staphylococcus aureus]